MKRVLIITYYWPPAGGPGVQRWVQFVKHFRDFGIEPIVYVPENPHYPLQDASFKKDVPSDITILKHPISEPYALAKLFSKKNTQKMSSGLIANKKQSLLGKLMLFIRGNFFIPDARIRWVKPSVQFLSNYISENNIDTIVTTGPPHSLHLIGLKLKQQTILKWVADFRDPWTTIHYHKSLRLTKASSRKHKELEHQVLNTADTVVVTSSVTKEEFKNITPKPIKVITNGYDASIKIESQLDAKFSIAHIGSLLSERNPIVLWKTLAEIASENVDFKDDLNLVFAGAISEQVLENIISFGLEENCKILGYVSHEKALQLQHNSQVLLLIEMNKPETKCIIPGKLFEYLAAQRPIMTFGPSGSDVSSILKETNHGKYFPYNDGELKETILSFYSDYKNNNLKVVSNGIEKYSRKALTEKMARLLKDI
ncbi:glycosyltransferase family 4 protein [Patiriisocius hiemis]|uniref:Glycosyltransferase family 4 protein n=1 Tax=Patiriisocius hiemis TaxID=3075604 RepID=A0ABU2YBA5_9FLAO|nr:glycosyltransferase family 4 protein [Constantimarinum sp. W242]MDT0555075.1 glycosyltransferase family 4 protein [Constantimarinum sp. W242]